MLTFRYSPTTYALHAFEINVNQAIGTFLYFMKAAQDMAPLSREAVIDRHSSNAQTYLANEDDAKVLAISSNFRVEYLARLNVI